MRLFVEVLRYFLFAVANKIPRFHTLDYARVAAYRAAGLNIGDDSRISGPLILEFSLRRNTMKNLTIGRDCFIGYHVRISASKANVVIGNKCNIGPNTSIDTAGHWYNADAGKRNAYYKPVVIGDNVWIGAGCIIVPGVTIGHNSVVAAGAVVAADVPEGVLAGGVPAKTIKTLSDFNQND